LQPAQRHWPGSPDRTERRSHRRLPQAGQSASGSAARSTEDRGTGHSARNSLKHLNSGGPVYFLHGPQMPLVFWTGALTPGPGSGSVVSERARRKPLGKELAPRFASPGPFPVCGEAGGFFPRCVSRWTSLSERRVLAPVSAVNAGAKLTLASHRAVAPAWPPRVSGCSASHASFRRAVKRSEGLPTWRTLVYWFSDRDKAPIHGASVTGCLWMTCYALIRSNTRYDAHALL
jgi:hypothetical protein